MATKVKRRAKPGPKLDRLAGARRVFLSDPRPPVQTAILVAVLIVTLFLCTWNNTFALGYHPDEVKKTRYIRDYTQDFQHPLLILQLGRLANAVFQLTDLSQIVVMARTLSAVYATVATAILYLLLRDLLAWRYRILATLAFGTSPIVVVHAHYLKEDLLLTCMVLLSLPCLFRFLQEPDRRNSLLLGVTMGLALSTHYKALLLLPFAFGAIAVSRFRGSALRYTRLGLTLLLALVVFLVINYPLVTQGTIFRQGLGHSVTNVVEGQRIPIEPLEYFFTFHLWFSIVPGLTGVMTVVALASILYFLTRWRTLPDSDRVLLLLLLVFHVAIESSKFKPPPDFMRYVLPEVPVLIYFAFKGLQALEGQRRLSPAPWFAGGLAVLVIVIPLQTSLRLDYHMQPDTRDRAIATIVAEPRLTIFEQYAAPSFGIESLAQLDIDELRRRGVTYLVASSFEYDRFFHAATLRNHPAWVRDWVAAYQRFFRYPYVEVRPEYRSFGFNNPTIRIIDIRKPQ